LGAIAERLISGCRQQSAELANLPFDTIARIAAPDDAQHAALEALRGTAREAAERFASDCPQSVPAGPAVRLEAMEQAIDAARAALKVVERALQRFYFALDDEKKARLLRDITLADAAARRASEQQSDTASGQIGAPPVGAPMQAPIATPPRNVRTTSARKSSRRSAAGRSERLRPVCDSLSRSALVSTSLSPPHLKPPTRSPARAPPKPRSLRWLAWRPSAPGSPRCGQPPLRSVPRSRDSMSRWTKGRRFGLRA